MLSIYKKEVSSYFSSFIGYLVIALFLTLTGLLFWVFPETSILENGYASLEGFFSLTPYLFIFLTPAVTMKAIAGEKAAGTYDLLLSRPLSVRKIVLEKFVGGITITTLAILPTIIYAASIYFLAQPIGNIDIGATIGSYLGLMLLAMGFVAIGLFCSALTTNTIVAFLLAVFLNFLFFYGFEASSQLSPSPDIQDLIQSFGFSDHYEAISRGVLTPVDFFYFISIPILFLVVTIGHLRKDFNPRRKTFTYYAGTLALITLVNSGIFHTLFDRIDFTSDKRYTLTQASKDILKKLDKDVYITVFLDGELPSGFTRLKKAAIDMAADLRSYSNGKLKFNILDPLAGTQQEQQEFTQALLGRGLYPTNLSVKSKSGFSQKIIFPGAIVATDSIEIPVNLLQNRTNASPEQILNNSIQNLEYAFISAISKINNTETPYIGFTDGHGEPSDLELYDAMHLLMNGNQVGRIHLDAMDYEGLKKLKIMIVVKPQKPFSESEKYKIDYFVRNGGHIIWALDQVDASLDQLKTTGQQTLIGRQLNLDDLLFLYGVRLNYNLIGDMNCGQIPLSVGNIGGRPQIELAPWLFHPILIPMSNHPVVKNLDGIRTEFISSLDTITTSGIHKEIILQSSPFAKTWNTPSTISLQMVEQQPDPSTFKNTPIPVAALLTGQFPYLFQNRPTPNGIQRPVDLTPISKPAKMMVIGDGDWLINQINASDQSPFPLGWDRYTNQQFANKVLLENVVDYLLNDTTLISLRNREVKLRMLDQAAVKRDSLKWQLINVGLPLTILLATGTIHFYWRKRKYQKKVA
ncbi:gliding motility-associated ABC transporter substrate-binding protein GldG [Sphingobacterium sp. SYP-B4668]|uniref:gliding motility-associated ABC transporter substrate-binding protein GldG n=1 Tax=Sphingobacterium sp. SYP-B4668 TaxID=2996035 RepID=UPI0022DE4F06|nr:gliding motility-associated ABC transporter substrate-binding protein GldG [Sphingobacterium sp. SYP-B4668]